MSINNRNQLSSKHTNLLKLIFLAVLTFLIILTVLYIQISFSNDANINTVNLNKGVRLNKTAAMAELKDSIKNSEPVTDSQKNEALEILRKSIINTK